MQRRLLGGGELAQVHPLATAPQIRTVGLGLAAVEVHTEEARRAICHAQRQPLRLCLLPRLLARQRRCRRRRRCGCSLRRLLPLRRPRDMQRRLLGGGELAQVHVLATARHLRPVGLGLAGLLVAGHAEVACLVIGHAQRQPLRLRPLPRLLACQRRCRRRRRGRRRRCGCSLGRRLLPLWRPRDAQRRLLGGGEVAQVHLRAIARHHRLVGLGLAGVGEVHAEVAGLVVRHEQRVLGGRGKRGGGRFQRL